MITMKGMSSDDAVETISNNGNGGLVNDVTIDGRRWRRLPGACFRSLTAMYSKKKEKEKEKEAYPLQLCIKALQPSPPARRTKKPLHHRISAIRNRT